MAACCTQGGKPRIAWNIHLVSFLCVVFRAFVRNNQNRLRHSFASRVCGACGSALPNRKHRVTLEPQGPRPIVLLFMSTNLFDAVFAAGRDSQTAVLCDQREVTYGELRAETIQVGEALKALGIEGGERVAVLLNDSPEFITNFVAIQSLGAIAVPINMALSAPDQHAILNDCSARTAIVEPFLCNTALTGARNTLRHVENLLVVCRGSHAKAPEVPGFQVLDMAHAPRQSLGANFPADGMSDTPAFILYTSGSTGEPKGAVHSQSDVFYTNQTFCKQVLDLRLGDRLFSSSRLPFAYGLGNSFSFPLLNGCTSVLCLEKPTPEVIGRTLSQFKPTIFFG